MLPRAHDRAHRARGGEGKAGRADDGDPAPDRAVHLRAAVNPELLGERTIWIDCDVIQADGGNAQPHRSPARTSRSCSRYIAGLQPTAACRNWPMSEWVAAVSVGMIGATAVARSELPGRPRKRTST